MPGKNCENRSIRLRCRRKLLCTRAWRPHSDRYSRRRSFALRKNCLNMSLAADEPRKKHRLFGVRIERALYDRLSRRGTDRRGKSCACQLPEAFFGLQERVRVLRIEIVPGIAGAIHHDLCGHRILRCKLRKFYAVSATAQTEQRARGKLTVSEPAYRRLSGCTREYYGA